MTSHCRLYRTARPRLSLLFKLSRRHRKPPARLWLAAEELVPPEVYKEGREIIGATKDCVLGGPGEFAYEFRKSHPSLGAAGTVGGRLPSVFAHSFHCLGGGSRLGLSARAAGYCSRR